MTRATKTPEEREEQKKKSGKGKPTEPPSEVWGGFINVDLTPDEKTFFPQWLSDTGDELFDLWKGILDDGLAYSVKADPENNCYIATFTGFAMAKLPNFKAAMSARGSNPDTSLALLVFKHVVLCEYDWHKYWTAKRQFGAEF